MSLLLAYTFNDNSTSPADFSGNRLSATSTNVTLVAGQNYGYAAHIGQTSANSYVQVANPAGFSGLTAFSVFTSCKMVSFPAAGHKAYICNKTNAFIVYIDSGEHVVFTIYKSGTLYTVTSSSTITGLGWHTVGCVWDGTTMYIYIDGVQDSHTTSVSGTMDSNTNLLVIGNDVPGDTNNTLVADVDCIEFRSTGMAQGDINGLIASPGGLAITGTPHNFATGDLIDDGTGTYRGIVTWVVDSDTFYFYPITDIGPKYSRVGNVYQSARQYYMEMLTDYDSNGNGQIKIKFPIAAWVDFTTPANAYTIDKAGYTGLAALSDGSTAITQSPADNSTKIATTAYVDGKTIDTTHGGTGIDSHTSTGVAQVNSGTWSISTALANGTTATTQSALDNSTNIATTAYVDTAVSVAQPIGSKLFLFYNY